MSSFPFNKTTPRLITNPPSHDNFLLTTLKESCMKLKHIYLGIFSPFAHFVPLFLSFYFIVLSSFFSSISNRALLTLNLSTKNPPKDLTRIIYLSV